MSICVLVLAIIGQADAYPAKEPLPKGEIIPSVEAADFPGQSYALYLPSDYSGERQWPVIIAFDPAARGVVPLERVQTAADEFGYIVAASNQSRHGFWKSSTIAVNAIWKDLQARFNVNPFRIYLLGFSSGARAASDIATLTRQPVGVILCGAGFGPNHPPREGLGFAVVTLIGHQDMHFQEVAELSSKLDKFEIPTFAIEFDGGHAWPAPDHFQLALTWLQGHAMRDGFEPRDAGRASSVRDRLVQRVETLVEQGRFAEATDTLDATIDVLDGMVDLSDVQERRLELEQDRRTRTDRKRRKRIFRAESRWRAKIEKRLEDLRSMPLSPKPMERALQWWTKRAQDLARLNREGDADQGMMAQRMHALMWHATSAQADVMLIEDDPPRAVANARIAIAIEDQRPGLWLTLARALARDAQPEAALEALEGSFELGFDDVEGLAQERDFDSIRETKGFQSLVRRASQSQRATD